MVLPQTETILILVLEKSKVLLVLFITLSAQILRLSDPFSLVHVVLNVNKTKKMIFDFRRSAKFHEPLVIHNHTIQHVTEYKYLGTVIHNKLKWNKNSQILCGKANQRLHFLRKLKEFHVDNSILVVFYKSLIQSILTCTFSLICNFGNLSKENVHELEQSPSA